jgi:hypothetical protein
VRIDPIEGAPVELLGEGPFEQRVAGRRRLLAYHEHWIVGVGEGGDFRAMNGEWPHAFRPEAWRFDVAGGGDALQFREELVRMLAVIEDMEGDRIVERLLAKRQRLAAGQHQRAIVAPDPAALPLARLQCEVDQYVGARRGLSPTPTWSTLACGSIGSITLRPVNSVCLSLTIEWITSLGRRREKLRWWWGPLKSAAARSKPASE